MPDALPFLFCFLFCVWRSIGVCAVSVKASERLGRGAPGLAIPAAATLTAWGGVGTRDDRRDERSGPSLRLHLDISNGNCPLGPNVLDSIKWGVMICMGNGFSHSSNWKPTAPDSAVECSFSGGLFKQYVTIIFDKSLCHPEPNKILFTKPVILVEKSKGAPAQQSPALAFWSLVVIKILPVAAALFSGVPKDYEFGQEDAVRMLPVAVPLRDKQRRHRSLAKDSFRTVVGLLKSIKVLRILLIAIALLSGVRNKFTHTFARHTSSSTKNTLFPSIALLSIDSSSALSAACP
ncbi:hypothetical protein MUK42_09779 [Musa troglodytarum]|uniref:Uncharacterized protein n=1 Tax=Musa troglodytarum TaxID=320322 RepID=A0A9E7EAZ5_9LILI|nr:hypothetical protein MUK42_09779 [Musa troglodytarum]